MMWLLSSLSAASSRRASAVPNAEPIRGDLFAALRWVVLRRIAALGPSSPAAGLAQTIVPRSRACDPSRSAWPPNRGRSVLLNPLTDDGSLNRTRPEVLLDDLTAREVIRSSSRIDVVLVQLVRQHLVLAPELPREDVIRVHFVQSLA